MTRILKLAGATALVLMLAGCQESLQQLNRDLANANAALAANRTGAAAKPGTMATSAAHTGNEPEVKLTVPNDPRTREAMDAALPTVKKALSIHQCVKVDTGMLQLNYLAVPGVNLGAWSYGWGYPNSPNFMKFHDRSHCVSVRAIDGWAMPALNALQFRVIYFAEDSGETVNFVYLMKKSDDGSWKIQSIGRS